MQVNFNHIKAFCLAAFVVFLFAFSSYRNNTRKVRYGNVNWIGEDHLFITRETVNKLLIQNEQGATSMPKEILDLNGLETALKSNPMIKTAEVYLTVNGEVRADVEQRKPVARVVKNTSFYIDEEGKKMPLSSNHSARVPLVSGFVNKDDLNDVFKIAKKIQNDEFLKMHIVEIIQHKNKAISLKARTLDFEIYLGDLNHLERKINNLKAFYQKAKKDKSLATYKKVNLQFVKQVVCTKK